IFAGNAPTAENLELAQTGGGGGDERAGTGDEIVRLQFRQRAGNMNSPDRPTTAIEHGSSNGDLTDQELLNGKRVSRGSNLFDPGENLVDFDGGARRQPAPIRP